MDGPLLSKGPFVRKTDLAALQESRLKTEQSSFGFQPDLAAVLNAACCTRERFEVVEIVRPVTRPADDESRYLTSLFWRVRTPAADNVTRIAILTQQLEPDRVDPSAVVAGVTWSRLTGPTGQRFARTVKGERALRAGSYGPAEILYDPGPGDTERIAQVRLGGGPLAPPPPPPPPGPAPPSGMGPIVVSDCLGRCRWEEDNGLWTLADDGCSNRTTTTTTTTEEGTTTTDECRCPSDATSTTTTSTTEEVSTTTTEEADCGCLYPTFCPTEEGECTYTYCSRVPNLPECVDATTTTPDCSECPDRGICGNCCEWVFIPPPGTGWTKISDTCAEDGCPPCIHPNWLCPCPPCPDYLGTCEGVTCNSPPDPVPFTCSGSLGTGGFGATGGGAGGTPPGQSTGGTGPGSPPHCFFGGCGPGCAHWWVPQVAAWVQMYNQCGQFCVCNAPSAPGGDECASYGSSCSPTRNLTCPRGCLTTTTDGGTSTSTTPGDGCDQGCKLGWNGEEWEELENRCGDCGCGPSPPAGTALCEVSRVPCVGTTTTDGGTTDDGTTDDGTTDTTEGTTTTPTTTTTTPGCESVSCSVSCVDGRWEVLFDNCASVGQASCDTCAAGGCCEDGAMASVCSDGDCVGECTYSCMDGTVIVSGTNCNNHGGAMDCACDRSLVCTPCSEEDFTIVATLPCGPYCDHVGKCCVQGCDNPENDFCADGLTECECIEINMGPNCGGASPAWFPGEFCDGQC